MSFGASRFGSSQFVGRRFGSGRFGASTSDLSLAAIRTRFVAAGMASLYLPYAENSSYPLYYGDGSPSAVGQVTGLIVDQLPADRFGDERFNIVNATGVPPNISINAGAGTITHTDTAIGGVNFSGSVSTDYGWTNGQICRVSFTASALSGGLAGWSTGSCFNGEATAVRTASTSGTYSRYMMIGNAGLPLRLFFDIGVASGATLAGNSVRLLNGRHLRQINESPRPSLLQSAAGVQFYGFPAGTSISPTVSIGSAGAGAMLVSVPGGAPVWFTGLTITSSFSISATHAASGAAAIALFSSYPDAATRSWLEAIFTRIGMGVRI